MFLLHSYTFLTSTIMTSYFWCLISYIEYHKHTLRRNKKVARRLLESVFRGHSTRDPNP